MKFIEWLIEAKTELPMVPHDDRDLIFGAYGAMKQFIPQIGEFGHNDIHKEKGFEAHSETNPYLLIVWDNKRKLMFRGSNNCALCTNYNVKKGTCDIWGQSRPMTQSFAMKHDIGGCVGLDFLPGFGAKVGVMPEQSKKYEGLQFALGKGYIFRYANGQLDTKPLAHYQIEQPEEELSPWERHEKEQGY